MSSWVMSRKLELGVGLADGGLCRKSGWNIRRSRPFQAFADIKHDDVGFGLVKTGEGLLTVRRLRDIKVCMPVSDSLANSRTIGSSSATRTEGWRLL